MIFEYTQRLLRYMNTGNKGKLVKAPTSDFDSRVITAKHDYRCDCCRGIIGKYTKYIEIKQYMRDKKTDKLTTNFYIIRKHKECPVS